jgi:Peptidase family M28
LIEFTGRGAKVLFLAGLTGLLAGLFPQAGMAQGIRFKQVERGVLENRIQKVAQKNSDREANLKALFTDAGCDAGHLEEQAIQHQALPNVICTLPGSGDSVILVGAHYDHGEKGDGVIDNWSGAALLPTLLQSLAGEQRKHTFVFVGFGEKDQHLAGSDFYAKQLSKDQISKIQAMIELNSLGLGATNIWLAQADKNLANILNAVAKSMNLTLGLVNADAMGDTDASSFRKHHIATLMVHSVTKDTFPILDSERDRLDALKIDDYYTNYRLLAAYLAYLDTKID